MNHVVVVLCLCSSLWYLLSSFPVAAAAAVAFLNLCVVAQDWEFPDFSEDDSIKIVAVDFSAFRLNFLVKCYTGMSKRLPRVSKYLPPFPELCKTDMSR